MKEKDQVIERMKNEPLTDDLVDEYLALPAEPVDEASMERIIKRFNEKLLASTVSETQKPVPHPFYGDSYERGLDPWHEDAFSSEFKHVATSHGERKGGWFLLDAFGNEIAFIPDGTIIEDSTQ
jgi:hypothetical protein